VQPRQQVRRDNIREMAPAMHAQRRPPRAERAPVRMPRS
jgi:hypothetical protein